MKRWIPVLVALLVATPAAAELYKWVDADGKVHYSDTPPPTSARKSERKKLTDKPSAPGVPYALQQAMKNFPVTLYTYACGEACTKGAALLAKRGVPHAKRDPMDLEVREEMKSHTGGEEIAPVLLVGRQVLKGYDEAEWIRALDAAGYPSAPVGPVPVVEPRRQAARKSPPPPEPTPESTPEPAPEPASDTEQ